MSIAVDSITSHCILTHYKKISYHKQIARKLRTQCVEGIRSNSMTLKYRLRVTEGRWKWHHSIDHIRLTISRVI